MTPRIRLVVVLAICWPASLEAQQAQQPDLPLRPGSVRFLVMGDGGTGDKPQYEVGAQMERYRQRFPFNFAIMLGDNIYGRERPQDFDNKFIKPYKALLDAKVEFHAALGNHDDQNQRYFKPYNLDGARYRTFKKGNVRFFVIDSNYLDVEQRKWLERELAGSGSDWKIAYFHHPLYTTARRGPEVELRAILEPLFVKYGVNVVFAGHEHIYERLKPQKGVYHFTVGGAAKLRAGDTKKGPLTDATFDRDRSFLLAEITDKELYYLAISRTGNVVDRGVISRR
ncbi:MAG: metallophosphoesterase [Gemmatimonadota bacterium]|nr:metallophosphoesterase [Gemmatimonadota bacterium]